MKIFLLNFCLLALLTNCSNTQISETYYKNGQLKSKVNVDEFGNFQGQYIAYFENGKISMITNYKNNMMNGKSFYFYESGEKKSIMSVINNKLNGKSIQFYKSGKIEAKVLFKDNLPLSSTFFYPNGKIEKQISGRLYREENDRANCQVYFNNKGKIINDPVNFKPSYYAIVNYCDNYKALKIKLFGLYNDSIIIKYKKNFQNEDNVIRTIYNNKHKSNEIILDIKSTDYYNGKLNILIETFQFRSLPNIKLEPGFSEMYIQLDKGEKPAKFNIDPIL